MSRVNNFIKNNFVKIVMFLCLIFFLGIMKNVFHKEIMKIDIIGYNLISTYLISDFATPITVFITNFGGAIFLVCVSISLLFIIKNKKIGLSILGNLVIITGLNFLLKNIVQRPRPTEYRLLDESGYSFPSGHSMTSMAFYGYLIYLVHKYIKNKYTKSILTVLLMILVFCIGISRIYLGVHYTSDVFAGFLISVSYLIIYIKAVNKFLIM